MPCLPCGGGAKNTKKSPGFNGGLVPDVRQKAKGTAVKKGALKKIN